MHLQSQCNLLFLSLQKNLGEKNILIRFFMQEIKDKVSQIDVSGNWNNI